MTVAAPLYYGFFGGESRTLLVDGYKVTPTASPTGWANVTTPIKTGVGATRINVNGSQHAGANSVLDFRNTYLSLWHAWVTQSGAPSAAYCLTGAPGGSFPASISLEVGTDSKIRLVATPGAWAARTALSGWSTTALATDDATFKEVALFLDPLTLGTSHVWATLFIDGTEQWSLDIGAYGTSATAFYPCPVVADAGIYVTLDDVAGLRSTASADAPHLKDWPKPEVHRQLPIADTAEDDWVASGGGSGDYGEWDDSAGPDNDTTYNRNITTWANKHQVSDGQTEATVGIDTHTVIQGVSEAGPACNIVYRDEGDGAKWAGAAYNSLGTAGALLSPGTTYIGGAAVFYKSGGWVITDVTALNFGCQVPYGAEHNLTWRVTLCMMQWLTYVNVYDHTLFTTPSLPGGVETTPAGGPVFMGLGAGIL